MEIKRPNEFLTVFIRRPYTVTNLSVCRHPPVGTGITKSIKGKAYARGSFIPALFFVVSAWADPTGTIAGSVGDPTGAVVRARRW